MAKIEVRAEAIWACDGRILLVNHERRGLSYWVLPGGHVEHGETLPAALAREMKEELGVDVAVGGLALVHDYITADRHVVNHAFRIECAAEARALPQGALKSARWVPLADLDALDLRPPIAATLRRIAAKPAGDTLYLPGI